MWLLKTASGFPLRETHVQRDIQTFPDDFKRSGKVFTFPPDPEESVQRVFIAARDTEMIQINHVMTVWSVFRSRRTHFLLCSAGSFISFCILWRSTTRDAQTRPDERETQALQYTPNVNHIRWSPDEAAGEA